MVEGGWEVIFLLLSLFFYIPSYFLLRYAVYTNLRQFIKDWPKVEIDLDGDDLKHKRWAMIVLLGLFILVNLSFIPPLLQHLSIGWLTFVIGLNTLMLSILALLMLFIYGYSEPSAEDLPRWLRGF